LYSIESTPDSVSTAVTVTVAWPTYDQSPLCRPLTARDTPGAVVSPPATTVKATLPTGEVFPATSRAR
jgi:hypothetical protein